MGNYLITCSNSKIHPDEFNRGHLSDLSFHNILGDFRNSLIRLSNIQLDWSKTTPAYNLYKGRLYSKISHESWLNSDGRVLILSALFGWIRPTDNIPYYDLSMNYHKVNNKLVYRYWLESQLLNSFVNQKNDIDLLSQSYRKAIHGKKEPVALIPDIKFRDNYGSHKGEWLNNELMK